MENVLIVAHRGASYAAPENTIPSFELAFNENADFVEADFWLTKDNEIVCIHDSNTKRVTKEKIRLNVRTSTLSELKKLDVGSWKGNEFKGTKIPTLQEVLSIIPEGKGIYLEIKDDRMIFMQKLAEMLQPNSIASKNIFYDREVRIIAFNPNTVQLAKKYFPKIKVYWLFNWYFLRKKCLTSLAQRRLIQTLQTLNCNGVDLRLAPYIDNKLVKLLSETKLDFCVYDVEKTEDALRLVNLGVDSITTNFPLKIREGIKSIVGEK